MPRKPIKKKERITVVVNGVPISVTLHPPSGTRKSWYAYWSGLTSSKSTGHSDFAQAVQAVEDMLQNGGERRSVNDALLSDEEFIEIQEQHYKKQKNQGAARKSLRSLLEAISAFQHISGLNPISIASAEDCERFQQKALALPRNWRSRHPNSKEAVDTISPTTVDKWSRALQAAWERTNRNAGRKCVRSVVPESKLLDLNPWRQFTWVECRERPLRQFDSLELLGLLEFLERNYPGVTVATALAKIYLWSWGRREEVVNLRWSNMRSVGSERHFEIVGKAGVEKWFRVPERLYEELELLRTSSPFVFAAYNRQLRSFHLASKAPWRGNKITAEFVPSNLGDWFYRRIREWSNSLPNGSAYIHVFRKTSLQYARTGEDLNRQVAADARLGEDVMMTNYVKEADPEMREKSNRTYRRIRASLSPEVAERYGYRFSGIEVLQERHQAAVSAGKWETAAKVASEIADKLRESGEASL